MEQRLDATYLQHGPIDGAIAAALVAAGLGAGIFLAAWGVSLLWRYTPPEIAVRVANPEVHIAQDSPLVVKQDTPFVLTAPNPIKIEQEQLTLKVGQPPSLAMNDRLESNSQTDAGDVIKREVTFFSRVQHGLGSVVTGWNYKDGRGGTPVSQFCYYTARNPDETSKRVDLAWDGRRLPKISVDIVPELEAALPKCQWWMR
jgi:hypothetical protein